MIPAAQLRIWCADAERAGRAGVPARLLADVERDALLALLGDHNTERDAIVVTALTDSRDPLGTGIEAAASGRSWLLNGRALHVPSTGNITTLIVVARSRPVAGRERGLRVYRLSARAAGVIVEARHTLDDHAALAVSLHGATVTDDDAVGPPRDARAAVTRALDLTTLVVVAEMLGAAEAALDTAATWVQERRQFGAPLAAKQVVQHNVANMAIDCAAVRALLDDALARLDASCPVAEEAAIAKLVASERLPRVTAVAHQLHGGEGYFADRPLHRWHRRVVSLAHQYGDAATQRRRLAAALEEGPAALA